jgi:subtilisin family serine protease
MITTPMNPGAAGAPRIHEMRIVVECDQRPAGSVLVGALAGALMDWRVTPLFREEDGSWVVKGQVAEVVGTADYARVAHTLVQRLLDNPAVSRAEADLPVRPRPAPIRASHSAADGGPCPPGSDHLRWGLHAIGAVEAWAVPPAPGGSARGSGAVIGHPDTGYSLHPNLAGALDLNRDRDVLDNDHDARDPLVAAERSPWPGTFPGHGTKTASVMVGRQTTAGGIVGVAPEAGLVPIRAVESVVQLFDTDVARSVAYAHAIGCDVVSLSLGGKGFFGLERAIQGAVDAGMIVLAAAGNDVGIVVAPASYPNCLAVAATGADDRPWPLSSRGAMVDVSAPGWCVWVAGFGWEAAGPVFDVVQETGTSYAVAHVAGVAALWLAHHGPETLRERYGSRVQAVFLHLLRTQSRVPAGWDATAWGAGIVDATAMLTAPLPTDVSLSGDAARGRPTVSASARLGALVNLDEAAFEGAVGRRLGLSGGDLRRVVSRYEGELAFHLLEEPDFRTYLLGGDAGDTVAGPRDSHATSSPGFAARFLGAPTATA